LSEGFVPAKAISDDFVKLVVTLVKVFDRLAHRFVGTVLHDSRIDRESDSERINNDAGYEKSHTLGSFGGTSLYCGPRRMSWWT